MTDPATEPRRSPVAKIRELPGVYRVVLLAVLAIAGGVGAVFGFELLAERAQGAAVARAPRVAAPAAPAVPPASAQTAPVRSAAPVPNAAVPNAAAPGSMRRGVPNAPPSTGTSHRVAAGETLAAVALRYDVPIEQLAADNAVAEPNLIRTGQTLRIGSKASGVQTVRPGDTLSSLARRHGLAVPALMALNPQVVNPDRIVAGGQLRIA